MFNFPNPVKEVASRVVASGMVVVAALAQSLQPPWVSAILACRYLANVSTGPRVSPLGLPSSRGSGLCSRWRRRPPGLASTPPRPPKRCLPCS